MWDMIANVIGMALFIGIYAYALSTEPLGGEDGARSGRPRLLIPHEAGRIARAGPA